MTSVFISYARGDDEPFVERLHADLTTNGFDVWWDRVSMPSRALTFLQEIRDAIDGCDRLLLVVGPRVPDSDYVRAEWQYALEACIPVTPVLRLGDYSILPSELRALHCPDARASRSEAEALAEVRRVLADPVPPLGALFGVPSLPAHFLPREKQLVVLQESILADVHRPVVITSAQQTTALRGMGGVGKSVLAASFARACGTRRSFCDGIIWVTLGQAAGDDMKGVVEPSKAAARLGAALAGKNCLIVLDDVWDVANAEHFANALGTRCRLLLTTRDGSLATALGAQELPLDVLDPRAALQLLADWSEQPVSALPKIANAVATECGYLPFALALCGAMARDGIPWSDLLEALRDADLSFVQQQLPNYPYPDVLRAVKVSVDALARTDPAWARHYGELAVFPSGGSVPESAVVQFWVHTNGLNERSARKLLTTLDRRSLLRLEGTCPDRSVTLHDLQHDYLRAALHDLSGLHAELLAAYQQKCPDGWHAGPDDGYFFQRLPHHLAQAGRADDLRELLLDYRWIRAKLEATGPTPLIADYDVDHSVPVSRSLQMVQGALRLSAHVLAQDTSHLPSQLTGRLLARSEEEIQSLLQQVRRETTAPWLRPLAASLTPPGGPLLRSLAGHTANVVCVAPVPERPLAISGSWDETLKIWDLEKGIELSTLRGHTNCVTSVAVAPDGLWAISGSWDCTLKVWDLEKGTELSTLAGHTRGVNCVAVTPDGLRAVSGSDDETVRLWNLDNEVEETRLTGHTDRVTCVAVAPDGRCVVSGSRDGTLKVWNLDSRVEQSTLRGHKQGVNCVAVTPDGRHAVSGSEDDTVRVWCLEKGTEIATLSGHSGQVKGVSVSLDGCCAVSGSSDRTLRYSCNV